MQWAKQCICNSGRMCFDAIEFGTKSTRIELFCGKCHGMICWWPISTEQVVPPLERHRTKDKSLASPTRANQAIS